MDARRAPTNLVGRVDYSNCGHRQEVLTVGLRVMMRASTAAALEKLGAARFFLLY